MFRFATEDAVDSDNEMKLTPKNRTVFGENQPNVKFVASSSELNGLNEQIALKQLSRLGLVQGVLQRPFQMLNISTIPLDCRVFRFAISSVESFLAAKRRFSS